MALFGLFKKKKEIPLPEDSLEVVKLWQTANAENDYPMVFRTAQRLVDEGYAFHWSLGECYMHGRGVPKDPERALYHFDLALEQGSATDMRRYADLLNDGVYIPQDKKRALYLYRTAAAHNEGHSCLYLYRLQTGGLLPDPQYSDDDLAWMLLNAVLDKTPGAKEMFHLHAKEHRKKADYYESLSGMLIRADKTDNLYEYTKKAASYGCSVSLYNLGMLHFEGMGTYKSYNMAARYWEGAVDLYNDINAMFSIGVAYDKNRTWERDWKEKMVYWYTRAADAGHADAMNNLAVYYRSLHTRKGDKMSFDLLTRAAEMGSAKAMRNLYTAYFDGIGVSRDLKTATKYLHMAAEQKDPEAMRIVEHRTTI